MKMFKLMGKRGFAVFTSLALCAGLVAPSFAATFWDLQHVISRDTGQYKEDAFTVTEDEKGNRTIKLNESVERGDATTDTQENIGFGKVAGENLTLDLNGHEINANGVKSALNVSSTVNLTIKDSSQEGTGTITGGVESGVTVTGGGSVTLESGAITGNTSKQYGGGVYVTNGTFTMAGGTISGNTAASSGGGVGVNGSNAQFIMKNDATISGNTAGNNAGDGGGGGVWIKSGAQFTMNGGTITENQVLETGSNGDKHGNGGGVAIHQAQFTMNGGVISNNESYRGTGVLINARGDGNASFIMNGGYTAGQDGTSCIWLEESGNHNATFELHGDAVMYGSIRLGAGTQVITGNVTQPGGTHGYTGFDVVENGQKTDSIAKDETEKEGGYELTADALLDVRYDHVYTGSMADNGNGTHSPSCKDCDDRDPNHSEDHNWNEGVTEESSCTTDKITYTCKDCGATKVEAGESDHHDWKVKVTEPTCTKTGLEVEVCSKCGVIKPGSEKTIDAKGHSWNDGKVTTEPTCTEEGVKSSICTRAGCTATKTEPVAVDPNNHTGVGEFENNGANHHKVCSACKTEVDSGDHTWDEGDWSDWAPTGDGETEAQTRTDTCNVCGATDTKTNTQPIPATGDNDNGGDDDDDTTDIDDPDVPLAFLPDEVEIDEPEVPLAGLITRADVIGYLWEKSGRPDAELSDFPDVPGDHEWAVAIGWAQDAGIAVADVDGNFCPDDLVLRSVEDIKLSPEGELEQFLNRYAVYAGIELKEGELFIALDGEWDEIIMGEDAQIILDYFFAKLETALAGQAA